MSNDQCSELFDKVFDSRYGGCVRTCECGITYFDSYNEWNWEDSELEKLQQKAKDDPKHYVEQNCAIGTMGIGGIEIVYGCTCDLAKRYEDFILVHAEKIAEYLNKRAVMLREKADSIEVKERKA